MALIYSSLAVLVILTIPLVFAFTELSDHGKIKVFHVTEFPIYSDHLFYLYFSSRVGEYPLYSVLIFIIRDGSRILEKSYFYPGFFYNLEYPFLGKFLHLIVAAVHSNMSISVRIQFNKIANWRHFDVRYGEFVSREKMDNAKENFGLYTAVMYSRTIELLIRTSLELNTLTRDGRKDGVVISEAGYLVCRGSGGYPKQRVLLTPEYGHQVIQEHYDEVSNEHTIEVMFRLKDHLSQYECATTDTQASALVNVFHHPTKLHLEPSYYSTMPNGSSVKCVADNGYPEPKIMWYFVRGPVQPDLYFNVYQDQLFLLPNAHIGSQWTFKCVAENILPNSQPNSTSLLFQFTVIHSSYRQFVLMASSAGIVVCIFTIIVVLVVIFRPRKSSHHSHPVPKQDVIVSFRKELAFDPDTAGSLKMSQSSVCVQDGSPKYDEVSNGNLDYCPQEVDSLERKFSKDMSSTCYV